MTLQRPLGHPSPRTLRSGVPLLETTPSGLFCPAGGFYVDPWRPVDRAVTTHAHSDHARGGCSHYLASPTGAAMLKARLGADLPVESLPFGNRVVIGDVQVSLHPAGHVLGSAQVRIESSTGEVWVVSGDYKVAADATCEAFEPVRCDTFISECTFGLPIYRWRDPAEIALQINAWWRDCAAQGQTCVLGAYSLGKAQRVLAMLDPSIGAIFAHNAVEAMSAAYRIQGVRLPETRLVGTSGVTAPFALSEPSDVAPTAPNHRKTRAARPKVPVGSMIICPPTLVGSAWADSVAGHEVETACASGWMQTRASRKRANVDRGFVLSDHADWPGLLGAIAATGAQRIGLTHGSTGPMLRFLAERGLEVFEIKTRFVGESAPESGATDPAEGSDP